MGVWGVGGEWSGAGGPVLFPLGRRLPLGNLGSQLPCLLLHSPPLLLHPLPLLLGPKEFGGRAARYKTGSPARSSLSRVLFPLPDATDHVALPVRRSPMPRAPAESAPSPRPDHPCPRKSAAAASITRPTTAEMSQPKQALTRRTGASRSSRPAAGWASSSCRRGRLRAGVALLW